MIISDIYLAINFGYINKYNEFSLSPTGKLGLRSSITRQIQVGTSAHGVRQSETQYPINMFS